MAVTITFELIATFVILGIAVLLLVTNKVRPDLVALSTMLVLYILSIITAQQALEGFANSTVILLAALFIVAEGLTRSGVSYWLGDRLILAKGQKERDIMLMMFIITVILGTFISNNGTVAIMIPIVVAAAWKVDSKPSYFLMPMAFVANMTGLLTLVSNNTNIIISNVLVTAGYQGFGFFEFTIIGAPLLVCTILYLLFFSKRFLPDVSGLERPIDLDTFLGSLSSTYSLEGNLFWLRVRADSGLVGRKLADIRFIKENLVNVLTIHHIPEMVKRIDLSRPDKERRHLDVLLPKDEISNAYGKFWERISMKKKKSIKHLLPDPETIFRPQDQILVMTNVDIVQEMVLRYNLGLQPIGATKDQLKGSLITEEVGLAEILITPRSSFLGDEVQEGERFRKTRVQILRITRRNEPVEEKIVRLKSGDNLLVRGSWEAIRDLQSASQNFVVVGKPQEMSSQVFAITPQVIISIGALILMVTLMATAVLPPEFAALLAALLMVIGRGITMEQAYRSIQWRILMIIAGLIPLATALEVTGGVEILANIMIAALGWNPYVLLLGTYVLASLMTQVLSNTVSTILLAPIILTAAQTLGLSPYPFMMMLAISVVTGFLTPIGTPTMLMVMTPGGYKNKDYMKLGLPLWGIILGVSMILVPLIWPF